MESAVIHFNGSNPSGVKEHSRHTWIGAVLLKWMLSPVYHRAQSWVPTIFADDCTQARLNYHDVRRLQVNADALEDWHKYVNATVAKAS